MSAPLEDVAVVELTQMVAGAFAGMHLSDLGADVVKIERPGTGEIARNVEPKVGGESFYYMTANRGKRSVALDLKSDAGREAVLDIAEDADVVLENFTPGTVERLGIGYDDVRERNPDVIYCSVSAFGRTGPKRDDPGVDMIVQAYTGIAAMTRDTDGRPLRVGITAADLSGGMYAFGAILAALRRRDRTGQGDYIDVALSDSLLSFHSVRAGYTFATGEPFPSIARSHVYFVPEGIFPTADDYLQVSAVTEKQWRRLCHALDREDLVENSKYETAEGRREHRDELNALLEDEFRTRSTDEWMERLREHRVPAERVNDTLEIWEDEHTAARDMRHPVTPPEGGEFTTPAYPVKHRTWEPDRKTYIAPLGADTADVLREVGYTDDELADLVGRE